MSLITWKDEFSLGIDSVDHEHRELIELINSLDVAMRDDATHATVVETLGEIYARIAAHFALEEKIMRDAHYNGYTAHKQDHETLLDELLEVIDSVDEDGVLPADFNATIATALGLPLGQEVFSPTGRPFKVAHDGDPVLKLL